MKALGVVVAGLALACGSSGTTHLTGTSPAVTPAYTGTVELSGGVTATAGVYPSGADEANNTWRFTLLGNPFNFVVNVPGSALSTGTFSTANSNISRAVATDGDSTWVESFDWTAPSTERGTFLLAITSTGPSGMVDTVTQWSSPHGTLMVTLPPGEGNTSTTEVSATATF
jgi:hypothetical protein